MNKRSERNKNPSSKISKNKTSNKTNKKITAGVMPLIKDYPSKTEWEDACWKKILSSKKLLQLFLTFHERHDLIMRAVALDRLMAGKSYKQISEELWLSPQTISGINKALKENNYRSYLERSKKERKKKKYSSDFNSSKTKFRSHRGIPRRTKYGTIYLP